MKRVTGREDGRAASGRDACDDHALRITSRKVTSDALIRIAGDALVYLRSLVFLPIIAKGLGDEAYGIWVQMIGTLGLLMPFLSLNLATACVRYLPIRTKKDEISGALFSSLAAVWATVGPFLLGGWLFGKKLSLLMFGKEELVSYIGIFLLLLFVRITLGFLRNYYRCRNRIKTFSVVEGAQIVLEIGLAAAFVTQTRMGLAGALWALIAVEAVFALGVLVAILREVGFVRRLDLAALRSYLSFSLPLIPNTLLMWVIDLSDRYVITHLLGLGRAAAYVAAYQIGTTVSIFMAPIAFGYRPAASSLWDSGEKARLARYMEKALKYYVLFLIPSLFGVFHLGPTLLRVLAGEGLVTSPVLVLLVAVGIALAQMNQITSYPISLAEKNRIFILLSLLAAMFNLGFNVWLIPRWGILAAAISTLLTYGLRGLVVLLISRRLLPFRFDRVFLLKSVLCSATMYGGIRWFSPQALGGAILVAAAGAGVYFALMILVRGVTREEWRIVKTAVRALLPHG